MSLASLDAALTGLRVSQQQINLISNNIANVGTPGYTRKILPQTAQTIQGTTVGVLSQLITRNVDLNLQRNLWTQVSAAGKLEVKAAYLSKVDQFHGPPDKELSVAASISKLQDSFSVLSDNPQSALNLSSVLNQAQSTATKINDLSKLINTLRNDVQNEMKQTVDRINALLGQITTINNEVRGSSEASRSIASQQDIRDNAIKELSQLMDVTYFQRGDGVLVIQTNQGVELTSDKLTGLTFNPLPVSVQSYYPQSAAAINVGNTKIGNIADITARSPGGKLGGLLELRDVTFPKQSAQLDEMAYRMASRLDQQGLALFTNAAGIIPADTPPDPTQDPPVPVRYVGFAGQIRVNAAILSDNKLLQQGTTGETIPAGSTEVLRRVIQFGFGDINYQQAIGRVNLSVSGNTAPNDTLQSYLGLASQNTVNGTRNLTAYTSAADFISAAGGSFGSTSNTFRITFEEPDLSLGPIDIDIDLSAVTDGAGNLAQDIIAHITGTVIPALSAGDQADLASMAPQFSVGANGQLVIKSNANITMDGMGPSNPMGQSGLNIMGFAQQTYEAADPYFDVKVGNNEFTRITIGPADDEADLLAKLQAVPGLAVEDFTASADGFLRIRPGNDYDNPDYGGDIQIVGGGFTTSGAGANTVIGPGTVPNGINIVTAIFGSFSAGPIENSPISDVPYSSLVNASVGSGSVPFRTAYLGPGANVSTNVVGAGKIVEFAQKMVSEQTQELNFTQSSFTDEDTLRQALDRQFADESGVNIDEELGHLVVVQNAYAAAARVINAVNSLFDELLNATR